MKIAYLAAGAAGAYCGACHRDVALIRGIRASGHDAIMLPLYTPLRMDGPDPSTDDVFLGGINCYLQQHVGIFRRTPRFVDWLLDRRLLLRWVSRFAIETDPEGLGPMTASVLRGEHGRQRKELDRLVDFLVRDARPDLVNLSNALLSSIAPVVKTRLGVPVVCSLQGSDGFVQRLPSPHREEVVRLLRENARAIDLFLAPTQAYAHAMSEFLDVSRDRVRVIRPGIELGPYLDATDDRGKVFRIGFLARFSMVKGLDTLCEAFRVLERDRPGEAILALAGQQPKSGRKLWAEMSVRLSADGMLDRVEHLGELDFPEKVRFLKRASVFCMPSRHPAQAIVCLEAMAAGAPIVVPDRGIFPEIVELTGGGLLVPPDDPAALAEALASLRDDPERRQRLGEAAVGGAKEHFSAGRMVRETLVAYGALVE